jgi:hypothetical protein
MKSDSISSQYTISEETKQDVLMRTIKVIDIGYVTVIYFVSGATISIIMDNYLGKFDPKKADKQSIFRITIEIILHLWFLGFLNYMARNLIFYIPFPLDGYKGFQHSKVKEVVSGSTFSFALFFYQSHMREKLLYFLRRVMLMKQLARDDKKIGTNISHNELPNEKKLNDKTQLIDPALQQQDYSSVNQSRINESSSNQIQSRSIRQQIEEPRTDIARRPDQPRQVTSPPNVSVPVDSGVQHRERPVIENQFKSRSVGRQIEEPRTDIAKRPDQPRQVISPPNTNVPVDNSGVKRRERRVIPEPFQYELFDNMYMSPI